MTKGVPASNLGAFSPKVEIVEGDGHTQIGFAAMGLLGAPIIYFPSKQKILEVASDSPFNGNWTITTI
jgi:hypothetical protein